MAEPTAAEKEVAALRAALAKRDKADAERQQAEQEAAEAQAQAAQEAADHQPDETIPGGRYLQGEVYVDCDGKPLKDQG